jgi:hypothetical protein
MADRIYNIKIDTDAKQSLQSVTGLKSELQRLEAEFETLTVGTEEFNKLGRSIQGIRSELKDIDLQFEGLDKEQRATALVDTFNGLTGAVGAVSSAFIAFGASSEAIENAEKKLLGVIGVVSGLRDASNGLVAAGKLIGPQLTSAFTTATGAVNGLRVAFAGLGIGAIIGLATLLASTFKDVNEETKKAKEEQDKYNKTLRDFQLERIELEKGEKAALEARIADTKATLDQNNAILEQGKIRERVIKDGVKLGEDFVDSNDIQRRKNEEGLKLANVGLENEILRYENRIKAIDKQAKSEASSRQKTSDDKRLADLKDQLAKEERAINEYNEVISDLEIEQLQTEEKRIEVQYEENLRRLRIQQEQELSQTNLTATAKLAIQKKFDLLEELELVRKNDKLETLRQAALDKQIAQTEASLQQVSQFAQGQIQELDFFYDEILARFQDLSPDDFLELIKTSDPVKFFGDTIDEIKVKYQELEATQDRLGINTVSNIQELARLQSEAVRKRALDEIKILEETQVKQIALFDKEKELVREKFAVQKAAALKNGEDLAPIFAAEEEAVKAVEDRKTATFKETQVQKKVIAETAAKEEVEITNRTAEQIEQRRLALNQFLITSVASLFTSLRTLNQVADSADEADKKRAFERDKQFATAEAIITGLLAVQRVFANAAANPKSILFPAQPYIEAALAGIATIARVRQIQSATFNSTGVNTAGGTGSTGTVSGNNANILNPFAGQGAGGQNILPQRVAPPTTGGAQGQSAFGGPELAFAGGQAPVVRAYVLAGDVTDAQTANFKLQEKRQF